MKNGSSLVGALDRLSSEDDIPGSPPRFHHKIRYKALLLRNFSFEVHPGLSFTRRERQSLGPLFFPEPSLSGADNKRTKLTRGRVSAWVDRRLSAFTAWIILCSGCACSDLEAGLIIVDLVSGFGLLRMRRGKNRPPLGVIRLVSRRE